MTSTIEVGSSLTSISLPTRTRCARLTSKGWLGSHLTEVILLCCVVVLPVVAAMLGTHSVRYGVGFVACVALVSAVLAWPLLGGLLLIALVPPLSGLAPGILVPSVRFSEALIGVISLTVLLGTRRLAAPRWGMLEWLLLAYGVLWALLAVFDSVSLGQHLGLSQWGSAFGQLQFLLLYRSVRITVRTPKQKRIGLGVLACTTVPLGILAILQEANVGGLRTSLGDITGNTSPVVNSGIIRATGLFANWAALAGFVLPILLALVALSLAGRVKRGKVVVLGLCALMVIALLLTAELSVLICLIIGVIVLGVQYGRSRKMLLWFGIAAAVSLSILGPVLGQRLNNEFGFVAGSNKGTLVPQTVSFRQDIWTQQYLPAIAQRPLDGYGVQLPDTVQWQYPESQYIALLVEGGYPLLIMYLCLLWGMFDHARRASRSRDPVEQALGRSLAVVVVSLLFLGITWPFLSNGGFPQVVWVLFALCGPASSRFARPDASGGRERVARPHHGRFGLRRRHERDLDAEREVPSLGVP